MSEKKENEKNLSVVSILNQRKKRKFYNLELLGLSIRRGNFLMSYLTSVVLFSSYRLIILN